MGAGRTKDAGGCTTRAEVSSEAPVVPGFKHQLVGEVQARFSLRAALTLTRMSTKSLRKRNSVRKPPWAVLARLRCPGQSQGEPPCSDGEALAMITASGMATKLRLARKLRLAPEQAGAMEPRIAREQGLGRKQGLATEGGMAGGMARAAALALGSCSGGPWSGGPM
jgi:hypothetical protein